MASQVLQYLLDGSLVGMALLSVFYLRGRRLSLRDYLAWGMVAVLLPAIGPCLIILSHPGEASR